MNNLNKTAIITGISSGIGFALAEKLLAEGYNVIGTTRSGTIEVLNHANLHIVPLEVNDATSREAAVKQITQLTQGVDLLINNAGAAPDVFTVDPEMDSFNQTMATNVTAVVFFTEPILPLLKNGAHIVFISSNMGLPKNAAPNGPAYRISKAAINMYAAILATRVTNRNIRVTPVHPGWVQTKLGGSSAPLTAAESARSIYRGINTITQSGTFYDAPNAVEEQF